MDNVLIFAGTTEGRELVEAICAGGKGTHQFFVSVATEYGKTLLPEGVPGIKLLAGCLETEEMEQVMRKSEITVVIDATHPYASEVSKNIKKASGRLDIPYHRLCRAPGMIGSDAVVVKNTSEAAAYLEKKAGPILLTIGSKELSAFKELKERVYPRILPMPEMVEKATKMGFDPGKLICMQGPFTYDMNLAMLNQIGAAYLVTKESGTRGGFEEKAAAARAAGAELIVIGRPEHEEGLTLEEAKKICGVSDQGVKEKASWFPFFANIHQKHIVVIGGGKIAARRIKTLLQFSCRLTVVAKTVQDWIEEEAEKGQLTLHKRAFQDRDLEDADFVVAATNDKLVNRAACLLCKEQGIPVNAADSKADCDFYFPGFVRMNGLSVGITAEGRDHKLAAKGRRLIEDVLRKGIV